MLGRSLILEDDEDAVVPTLVFAGMKTWSVDRVLRYVRELFLALQNRQLILLEDFKKLLVVSQFDFVDRTLEEKNKTAIPNKNTPTIFPRKDTSVSSSRCGWTPISGKARGFAFTAHFFRRTGNYFADKQQRQHVVG